MKRLLRAFIGVVLVMLAGAVGADDIELIQLHNQPAEQLVPVLRPLLDPAGTLTGTGFQLIVRTSPENLAQLKRVIAQLDTAPRQLLVSVFQGDERSLREASTRLGVDYRGGDVEVRAGQPGAPGGIGGRVTAGDLGVSGSVRSTRVDVSDKPVQQLRVLEGSDGYIETGQSLPFFSGRVWKRPGPDIVESRIDYRDVTTGFYVRPRVAGDEVILEINPHRNTLSDARGGAIDTRSAATTVRGALGQWIEIGGADTDTTRAGSTLGGHYETREKASTRLWIRADVLH